MPRGIYPRKAKLKKSATTSKLKKDLVDSIQIVSKGTKEQVKEYLEARRNFHISQLEAFNVALHALAQEGK